uniref:Trafficking protein particle complex subunit n=1 Tax=Panagrellus redivivus TaxID=6233 RepID=A0A7E4UZD6_PANRE
MPPPSVPSLLGTEFPFNFLHAEIIKYYIEKHEANKAKRAEFLESTRLSEDSQILESDRNVYNHFALRGNPETRIEALGYRVGYALVEKVARDIPRLSTELEKMKFICKDFWMAAFGKQVDNLRTNHQNIYVVQDNKFFTVASLAEGTQYLKEAAIYLAFPAGVVRGALANLGIKSVVQPTIETLPVVKFNVHLHKSV